MAFEECNSLENTAMGNKSIIVCDAYKCYSDIISMRGLNMSVPMGSMYVLKFVQLFIYILYKYYIFNTTQNTYNRYFL